MCDIGRLRDARGGQKVTFNDIADHLCDFVDRYPAERASIERLARFLTMVEQVGHDHDAGPDHGLVGVPAPEVPRV